MSNLKFDLVCEIEKVALITLSKPTVTVQTEFIREVLKKLAGWLENPHSQYSQLGLADWSKINDLTIGGESLTKTDMILRATDHLSVAIGYWSRGENLAEEARQHVLGYVIFKAVNYQAQRSEEKIELGKLMAECESQLHLAQEWAERASKGGWD